MATRRPFRARPQAVHVEPVERRLLLAAFTVTTTGDTGPGTLRQAILDANANPGADEIRFNIPGEGTRTIAPASPLPELTGETQVIGQTAPGTGLTLVQLDGSGAGPDADGLVLSGGNSLVRWLTVNRFSRNGIVLTGSQGGSRVIDVSLGTGPYGLGDLGNGGSGLVVRDSPNNVLAPFQFGGGFNYFSGNGRYGIELVGPATVGTSVSFAFVGTNGEAQRVGNDLGGVLIDNARSTFFGSPEQPQGFDIVVSGNGGPGITIAGQQASENRVSTTRIGTTPNLLGLLGNGGEGVVVRDGAHDNSIGAPRGLNGGANVIAGNGGTGGVRISGAGTTGNRVFQNYIGTTPAGDRFGNGPVGVGVLLQAPGNFVTGNPPGFDAGPDPNHIAFNKVGVAVEGDWRGNVITENEIYSNEGLGIDLGRDGVTPNDAAPDADGGANGLQNYPVLSDAVPARQAGPAGQVVNGTRIRGTLDGAPGATFRLSFYANASADPSGYGEGEAFLGTAEVTTDGAGHAAFDTFVPAAAPAGRVLTATATAADGSTSEFSAARTVRGVVSRFVFYNRSAYDGDDPAANSADDNAVATDKRPLFDGAAGSAQNVTGYSRGINGVMVDLEGAAGPVTADDFTTLAGTGNFPAAWPEVRPSQVVVRPGAGVNRSDRVELVFDDGRVRDVWLAVVVKANGRTGLEAEDRFYFGNLVGDVGDGLRRAQVDALDLQRTRFDQLRPNVTVEQPDDFNHDGRVNAVDLAIARANQLHQLEYIFPATLVRLEAVSPASVRASRLLAEESEARGPMASFLG